MQIADRQKERGAQAHIDHDERRQLRRHKVVLWFGSMLFHFLRLFWWFRQEEKEEGEVNEELLDDARRRVRFGPAKTVMSRSMFVRFTG